MFDAFNRWLEEDWGFDVPEPHLRGALHLARRRRRRGASSSSGRSTRARGTIVHAPGGAEHAARAASARRLDGFDPFWARVNEAGITVVAHAGDSGYSLNGYGAATSRRVRRRPNRFGAERLSRERTPSAVDARPSVAFVQFERAIYDFLASLVLDDFFGRFPNIRVASVENGAEFLPDMFRKLRSARNKMPDALQRRPGRDVQAATSGSTRSGRTTSTRSSSAWAPTASIFGSDWPHIEGMQQPLDYLPELKAFDDDDQRRILRDNAEFLNTPQPL